MSTRQEEQEPGTAKKVSGHMSPSQPLQPRTSSVLPLPRLLDGLWSRRVSTLETASAASSSNRSTRSPLRVSSKTYVWRLTHHSSWRLRRVYIKKAGRDNGWKVDFTAIIQLWRGGCIVQSNSIADLLERVYQRDDHDDENLLANREIGAELEKAYPSLKKVVLKSIAAGAYVPSLSASLEYYKYSGSTEVPTQFMEAQLDYCGGHMYDLKSAEPGTPATGCHHFEWRPAKGIFDHGMATP